LPGDVTVVPFGDTGALAAAVGPGTAAVVLEPIQGEGGVIVPPDGYLAEARAIATAAGALLVLDEVQTGIGRTGTWFAHQRDGIEPDVVTLAKGLGGGLPIGACLAFGPAAALFQPGSHGSTFGGNPVSARAALTVLDVLEEDGILLRIPALHDRLAEGLAAGSAGLVDHVRGRGLLLAAALREPRAAEVERACREHGLIVNAVAPDAIRLAPALTITDEDISLALDRWAVAMSSLAEDAA
jgi:acetylornithine aminotransferase